MGHVPSSRAHRRPSLCANIQPGHRRFVVAHLRGLLWPRVGVDMLVLCFARPCDRVWHEHVVELLRAHVEQVGVLLQLVNPGHGIQILGDSTYANSLKSPAATIRMSFLFDKMFCFVVSRGSGQPRLLVFPFRSRLVINFLWCECGASCVQLPLYGLRCKLQPPLLSARLAAYVRARHGMQQTVTDGCQKENRRTWTKLAVTYAYASLSSTPPFTGGRASSWRMHIAR